LPTGTRDVAKQFIKRHLQAVEWLDDFGGQTLYPVGGAWRTVARRLQKLNKQRYPIQIVQNSRFDAMDVRDLAHELSKKRPEELVGLEGIKERRAAHLPRACLVLSRLIKRLRPKDVVFSAHGIREGLLWESLDAEQRRLDPLLEYCRGLERAVGKAHQGGPLADWITPLFNDADHPGLRRLRLAACILSDIGWFDDPNYRAYHAAQRTLRLPYVGIEHWERAWLSAAIHARYSGDVGSLAQNEMAPLMGEAGIDWARRVGRALRLAHNLCGGAISLLQSTSIVIEDRIVVLHVPKDQTYMVGDATKRRLDNLAQALGGLQWRLGSGLEQI
jgi:exopolyphosphatase/guanosine-5'-triphosphate,3'-diphosphate pyrophosphatase